MILTVIVGDPHDVHDRTPDRIQEIPARELTEHEQNRITAALAREGIRVTPVVDVFGTVCINALEPCTTAQEVRAIAMFRACTDCRLAWHEVGAS